MALDDVAADLCVARRGAVESTAASARPVTRDGPAILASPAGLSPRLGAGISWHLLGAVFDRGSTFALNVVVANLLGRHGFGEYAMVHGTALTLFHVAQLATGSTVTKYVAELRSTDPARSGRILALCAAVSTAAAWFAALGIVAGAPWLAGAVLHAPHLATGLMIVAPFVFFAVMNGYQMGTLAGLEGFRALAAAGVIAGSLYFAVGSLAAWAAGLEGALVGLGVSAGLQWLTLRRFLGVEQHRRHIVTRYHGLLAEVTVVRSFLLPAALSGCLSPLAVWLASTFLVRRPGGYEEMALFSAANNFRIVVLFLPTIVNSVGMAVLNNQRGRRDEVSYWRVFWINAGLTVALVLVGVAVVLSGSPWLLAMFGRDFGPARAVLGVVMLSTIPEALALAAFQVIQSHGRMWLSLLALVLPRDLAIAILSWFWSPTYGAVGLGLAHGAAWAAVLPVYVCLAWGVAARARAREDRS